MQEDFSLWINCIAKKYKTSLKPDTEPASTPKMCPTDLVKEITVYKHKKRCQLHYFKKYLFIYLFCPRWVSGCTRAFSSSSKWRLPFVAVHWGGFSCGTQAPGMRLSSCGTWAQLLLSMRDPPRPGIKPASAALAGRLPTTGPPGKFQLSILIEEIQIKKTIATIPSVD